jgi:predicted transcriptional regulator
MTTLALKDALHRLVIDTNDDTILQQVQSFFLSVKEKNNSIDWWQSISDKEKVLISKGLEDAENGKLIPNDEVRAFINEKIGKK